jgi:enterochelin esterase-like enzyme
MTHETHHPTADGRHRSDVRPWRLRSRVGGSRTGGRGRGPSRGGPGRRILVLAVVLAGVAPTLPVGAPQASAGTVDRTLPWVTPPASAPGVVYRTFESRVVGAKVSYHAYLPAAYARKGTRLPVLYWLHGTEGGIGGIAAASAFFREGMDAGTIPPMIVVFVNGLPRRLWADSKDGSAPVETVFVNELIPTVDRTFRTIASRQGRILEGFSMGGYGAARLGFSHPDVFAGISILAGGPLDLEFRGPRAERNPGLRAAILRDVCGGDLAYFAAISPWMAAEAAAPSLADRRTVVRQAVGTADDTLDLSRAFHDRMTGLGIEHEYREIPGVGHDATALLNGLAAANGAFYRRALARP